MKWHKIKKINKDEIDIGLETAEINNKECEKKKHRKNSFNTIEVIIIMIITVLFGLFIGSAGTYFVARGGFNDYSKDLKALIATYEDVVNNYYGEIDSEKILESGVRGMITYLGDPYSSYIDGDAAKEFNEKLEGEYIGLGAEIMYNKQESTLKVNKVFKDSPADKSNLQEGDLILKVDGKDIKGLELEQITEIIKTGKVGTTVRLDVKRDDKDIVVEFTRETVELTSVVGEIIEKDNKKVGLITIEIFAKNSYKQFKNVVEELQEQGATHLIIDVRDNTGGYLSAVKSIAEMFLDKKDVIFIIEDKNGTEKQLASKKKSIELPTVMLVNGGSASASEVLAAALSENLEIDLVGTKTYGKGSVQQTKILSSGATIKYTTQKWLTPTGKSIDGEGINPTVEVELDKEYYENPSRENDLQLQKAIEVVIKK